MDTTTSEFRKSHAFLKNFHDDVVDRGLVGTDPATGKSQTMVIGGYGFEDPKTGKIKEYLLPAYDPETKSVLTDDQVREKFLPLIKSGEVEGFPSIEAAHANMLLIRGQIIGNTDARPGPLRPEVPFLPQDSDTPDETRLAPVDIRLDPLRPGLPRVPPSTSGEDVIKQLKDGTMSLESALLWVKDNGGIRPAKEGEQSNTAEVDREGRSTGRWLPGRGDTGSPEVIKLLRAIRSGEIPRSVFIASREMQEQTGSGVGDV